MKCHFCAEPATVWLIGFPQANVPTCAAHAGITLVDLTIYRLDHDERT